MTLMAMANKELMIEEVKLNYLLFFLLFYDFRSLEVGKS